MTDETQVVDPETDNSTPLATETEEQPAPSEEENAVEPEAEVEPETEIEPSKEERWRQQLQGSKEEAMRLKAELEQAQKALNEAKASKSPDDIAIADEDLAVIEAAVKKLGYVKHEELEKQEQVKTYKQVQSESLNTFLKEHPEYNKPGDAESDNKWKALQSELALYNTSPQDPSTWYKILKKAHRDINSNPDLERARGEALGMAKANYAEQAKIGGGSSGEVSTPKGKQTPEQLQFAREIEEQLTKKPYYQSK